MIARTALALATVLAFAGLALALLDLPVEQTGLAGPALDALDRSGVENPVTAVLLNFRGYDTLLEVAVLLLAVVAVWSFRAHSAEATAESESGVLAALLRYVLPLLVVTGGYLLWIGAFAPGGAFQGGALVAGAIVLALLAGRQEGRVPGGRRWPRAALAVGLFVFIAVGLGAMALGGRLLEYPGGHAGTLILVIEAAALVTIALALGALFLGGRPLSAGGASGQGEL
jgi:multisubunit Na+/H+ antiporter MnhB subunit